MMCLSSEQRSQNLAYLSTDCMHLNKSGCVFNMSKLLKTSRPKSHQKLIEFKAYPHDVSLCVVALIKLHLDKTAVLSSKLHVFYQPCSPTQTSFIKNTGKVGIRYFTQVGIHTKTFKSHSLRSASTSNAFSGGLSIPDIAKVAGWTNLKTFGKFCKKTMIDINFGNFLLKL